MDMKDKVEQAKQILKQVKLQTIPPEILQLEAMLDNPNPNTAEVARVLSHNPEVLGEFLGLANRVLNRVEDDLILDAASAVHLLGLNDIRYLFLSGYLIKNLPTSETDHKVVLHSMRAGIASAELSHWIYGLGRCEAYLASFMQDVGALYMMRYDPQEYAQNYFSRQLDCPLSAYRDEEAHYQTAHTFVGGLIAKRWNLGNLLYRSIVFHHHDNLLEVASFDPKAAQMVAANRIANYLVFKVFSDHFLTQELEHSFEEAQAFLNLPENALHAAEAALQKWGWGSGFHLSSH